MDDRGHHSSFSNGQFIKAMLDGWVGLLRFNPTVLQRLNSVSNFWTDCCLQWDTSKRCIRSFGGCLQESIRGYSWPTEVDWLKKNKIATVVSSRSNDVQCPENHHRPQPLQPCFDWNRTSWRTTRWVFLFVIVYDKQHRTLKSCSEKKGASMAVHNIQLCCNILQLHSSNRYIEDILCMHFNG